MVATRGRGKFRICGTGDLAVGHKGLTGACKNREQ